MAKRGPKPKPDNVVALRRTARPDRPRAGVAQPGAPIGDPVKPKWLTGHAGRIWKEKVARYKERGIDVVGCESTLATLCVTEARIIKLFKQGDPIPASLTKEHRIHSEAFYDTPASAIHAPKSGDQGNLFGNNGRPPPADEPE